MIGEPVPTRKEDGVFQPGPGSGPGVSYEPYGPWLARCLSINFNTYARVEEFQIIYDRDEVKTLSNIKHNPLSLENAWDARTAQPTKPSAEWVREREGTAGGNERSSGATPILELRRACC
ncbi:hypothetical protein V6N12_062052 [Hibiscus sabdariffa]|uniref:Uncharacterized protein n=1 Tax=Hibiscus sabdariffa TaxID=183260 RepID=A0ABR2AQ58_9ROSI